jgi:hypothetical protein
MPDKEMQYIGREFFPLHDATAAWRKAAKARKLAAGPTGFSAIAAGRPERQPTPEAIEPTATD